MRTKFKCHSVDEIKYRGWDRERNCQTDEEIKNREEVKFYAVCGGSDENKSFATATPTGAIRLTIDNPAAWGHFVVGKEYYVDFFEGPAK